MKVIVNKPAMPVIPPTTYDLVGLTEREVATIRHALFAVNNDYLNGRHGSEVVRHYGQDAGTVWRVFSAANVGGSHL